MCISAAAEAVWRDRLAPSNNRAWKDLCIARLDHQLYRSGWRLLVLSQSRRKSNDPGVAPSGDPLDIRTARPIAGPWGSFFAVAFHSKGRRHGDVAFTAGLEARRRPRHLRRPRDPPPDSCGSSAPVRMSRSRRMALPVGFEPHVSVVLSTGSGPLSYGISLSPKRGNFVAACR